MSWMRRKSFALVVGTLGLAALLGGSLGVVTAGTKAPLRAGFNLAGGPLSGDVPPADFVGCLPSGSWNALYIWNGANQSWQHFFNPTSVPGYVNSPAAGGIDKVPRFAGVVILMAVDVASPQLRDRPGETCS
ncbi:MAG: hypothetical protein IT304_05405 [Dehalococcoidia bacterium]|nr:hypothetical protein [Dehalococcoidia bacterium]